MSQRLDSLRRLAGGVAHDYNNLLTSIMSFGGFVKDALTDQVGAGRIDHDVAREMLADLDRVLEAGQRATGLSRQLQLFGSRATFRPVAVDLNAVVDTGAKVLVDLIGDEIDVEMRLDPGVRAATGAADQVLHVLQVLISNARDAMPDGGALLIETANLPVDDAAAANLELAPGDFVRLTVSDTGCGMPDEVLSQAIEPFFTTKAPGAGPGLGLATAYGIATQVGGNLTIESEPGAGTTVHLILPAAGVAARAAGPGGGPPSEARTQTVLVVDDEAAVRELVARMLGKAGYQVLVAADGQEALALAEQSAATIACLVTDVVMPRMLGSELAQRLTAQMPGLAVLFMSGYADPMLGPSGGLDPAMTMLFKPFTDIDLLSAVHAAIRSGEPAVRSEAEAA
jgi:CheY-like chemotaxis protein